MNTEHTFLTSGSGQPPERWSTAFPEGKQSSLDALLPWLRSHSFTNGMLWLSSANPEWPDYLKKILEAQPDTRVVLLTNTPDPNEGLIALNSGVRGYTHAYAVPALLKEVALVLEHGGLWVGPDLMQRLVASTGTALASRAAQTKTTRPTANKALAALSAREAEVARAVSAGHSNREVAALMHISERTVKAHLGTVFEKLGVRDRLQLVLRVSAGNNNEDQP